MLGLDKFEIYKNLQVELPPFLLSIGIVAHEIAVYDRLLLGNIHELPATKIRSKGYVVDTLEASTWCLLTTENYPEAILKAVNLGEDTDTTAAVTGGLAGLLYGLDGIPAKWLERIAKREEIEDLAERLAERFGG
jgi:ADP-ribosylglycohydrolase